MCTVTFVHTVRVKKNATICKICVPLFDKKLRLTFMLCLWICTRSDGIRIAAIFAKCATFSRQKAPQSLNCGALQDGALRRGHQSVMFLVGEKRRTCRHVYKCHCCTLVYHMYVIYVHEYISTHYNNMEILD